MADSSKTVTYEQFMAHQQRENLWVLLHGKVYDVAKFLDEHPGGEEVIVAEAEHSGTAVLVGQLLFCRKDATESFEDVGHSDEARDLLKGMLVGTFDGSDKLKAAPAPAAPKHTSSNNVSSGGGPSALAFMVPLAALGAYFAYRYYGA